MEMQFNKHYPFAKLKDGDRFYFMGDKKKVVHEVKIEGEVKYIKTDKDPHFTLCTMRQRADEIIFLRHRGAI